MYAFRFADVRKYDKGHFKTTLISDQETFRMFLVHHSREGESWLPSCHSDPLLEILLNRDLFVGRRNKVDCMWSQVTEELQPR